MDGDAILAALTRLESGQAGLQAGLTDMKASQAEMRASQADMKATQADLKAGQITLRVDLMARMDRLEDKVTSLRDDIAVNFGAVDAVKRANDNTREELRNLGDMVSAIMRKVNRLETDLRGLQGP